MTAWPSALLRCVRHPGEHDVKAVPFEDYPISSRSGILGPVRAERCETCGSLMYVAAARVQPQEPEQDLGGGRAARSGGEQR